MIRHTTDGFNQQTEGWTSRTSLETGLRLVELRRDDLGRRLLLGTRSTSGAGLLLAHESGDQILQRLELLRLDQLHKRKCDQNHKSAGEQEQRDPSEIAVVGSATYLEFGDEVDEVLEARVQVRLGTEGHDLEERKRTIEHEQNEYNWKVRTPACWSMRGERTFWKCEW